MDHRGHSCPLKKEQNPHPFDFAQGRLCLAKVRRDKDGAPSDFCGRYHWQLGIWKFAILVSQVLSTAKYSLTYQKVQPSTGSTVMLE